MLLCFTIPKKYYKSNFLFRARENRRYKPCANISILFKRDLFVLKVKNFQDDVEFSRQGFNSIYVILFIYFIIATAGQNTSSKYLKYKIQNTFKIFILNIKYFFKIQNTK